MVKKILLFVAFFIMVKKILLFVAFFIVVTPFASSQIPLPTNGVQESEASSIVLRNATIIVSPEKTISKGSLVIKNGRVKTVGRIVRTPKGAVEIDMEGKTIVPSFIESYSNIGLPDVKKKEWSPRPQIESSKKGSFYWNEAIHPEVNAAALFKKDANASKNLQKMGFAIALTHIEDGIARGTSAAIALGDIKPREAIIKSKSAAYFSLEKGVSSQSYPSSQMGAIALLRQAIYDAKYYAANKNVLAENISLQALSNHLDLPLVIVVKDKLEVLRAQKIAEEFDLQFTIIGAGNEFERLDQFKEWETPLILPINFSKAYNVKDPYISRQIPLRNLKEWEIAPANPYLLRKNNVTFAITSKGHKKPKEFWKHLHRAMESGLSREDAIAALTLQPAKIFNIEQQAGTLDEGKIASFSVFDKDPFVRKDAEILESWSLGKQHILQQKPIIDVRGKYRISLPQNSYVVDIKGEKANPNGTITTYKTVVDSSESPVEKHIDTAKVKVDIHVNYRDAILQFSVDDDHYTGALTLHGNYDTGVNAFIGQGQLPNGRWIKWTGIQLSSFKTIEADPTKNKIEIDTTFINNTWFPNMAYGFDSLPEQKTYVLRNATLWTNEKEGIIKDGTIIIKDGKIDFVGTGNYSIPSNAEVIDCKGKHITTGIIDEHSHIAISKGVNEGGQAVSAEVSIAAVIRSDDINIYRQLAGGVTTSQLLHGSANPIGGQSAIIKLKWGMAPEEMKVTDMPKFIKFALGENVKQSNWGDYQTLRFPQTRMGVEQVFYDAFHKAEKYHTDWSKYNDLSPNKRKRKGIQKPAIDLELETVWEVMNSERFITCHSYVQSEINMLMKVADSMGFAVNTFTHVLEGYKLADKLAEHGAGASTFSDWWAYKFEVKDAIPYNANLMQEQGVTVAINSDDAEMGRRLNQEAAKSVKYGGMSEIDAWKMVTLNPAKLLHLDDRMGSLKVGKDADIVIWTDNPLSIQAKVNKTFIDGALFYNSQNNWKQKMRIQKEKARIISKMLVKNKNGEPSKEFKKKKENHWHCDTVGSQKD